jgi:hypothetical protein
MSALQYLAGQRLTADALQRAVPDRVVQGSDQTKVSSTTLSDSGIVITVDGLLMIDLVVRYRAEGGGIRWAWSQGAGVSNVSRHAQSAGSNAAGTASTLTTSRLRGGTVLTSVLTVVQFDTGVDHSLRETLVVDGAGTLTFQFAQETGSVNATTVFAESYAQITRLGS